MVDPDDLIHSWCAELDEFLFAAEGSRASYKRLMGGSVDSSEAAMFRNEENRLRLAKETILSLCRRGAGGEAELRQAATEALKQAWHERYGDSHTDEQLEIALAVVNGDATRFYNRFHRKSPDYNPYP